MRIFLTLLLTFLGSFAIGQDYIFKVMANKGSNMVKVSDQAGWKEIRKGDALREGYWVKVSSKAYLGLVHNSGKTTALENPGEFDVASIESAIKNKKKGLGAKYTDFVLQQSEDAANDEAPMMTRGDSEAIEIYLPLDGEVIHPTVHIRWKPMKGVDAYTLRLVGIFDDVLAEIPVTGSYYLLDLTIDALEGQETFIVSISPTDDENVRSEDYIINRLTSEEQALIAQTPDESGTTNAMDLIALAGYYEENNLLIDASNFYQQAVLKAPDVEDFQTYYTEFLKRHSW